MEFASWRVHRGQAKRKTLETARIDSIVYKGVGKVLSGFRILVAVGKNKGSLVRSLMGALYDPERRLKNSSSEIRRLIRNYNLSKFAVLKIPMLFVAIVLLLINAAVLPSFQVSARSPLSNVQPQAAGEISSEEFRPEVIVTKELPALKNIAARPIADANMILRDEELVLGVEIEGRARAYPINMLSGPTREIINDELNGVSIAATW